MVHALLLMDRAHGNFTASNLLVDNQKDSTINFRVYNFSSAMQAIVKDKYITA